MLTIKGASDKPCFICKTTRNTRIVKLDDKTFSGVLCIEHIAEKTSEKPASKEAAKESGNERRTA